MSGLPKTTDYRCPICGKTKEEARNDGRPHSTEATASEPVMKSVGNGLSVLRRKRLRSENQHSGEQK